MCSMVVQYMKGRLSKACGAAIAIGAPFAAIGVPPIHLSAFVTTQALIAISHRAEAIFCFLVDYSMLVTKIIVDQ